MKFKSDKIEADFSSSNVSWKLKEMIRAGDKYAQIEFGKELVITDLLRTQESQDRIYKDNPNYHVKPWKSVHQYGRGCDIRTRNLDPKEIEKLTNFFNLFQYDKNRPDKKSCLVHDVGSGHHFHVQCI